MSQGPIISVQNVSKVYRIWRDPSERLFSPILAQASRWIPGTPGERLKRRSARGYQDFYALKDVSFELHPGEAVGIIGRNGAGKSTLLQIIAGTLQPSAGTAGVHGRIAALLELGAGFNPDFTGRENVYLSAAVLGVTKREMDERFDEVAGFADIGEFMDQAVKTYSSGMMMRLAFAVNTCVDPDILIVDEALSVGDAPFQAKCFRRLRQLVEKGVSLLFVSHDIGTVRSICTRALWLKHGHAEMWGEAKEVAKHYERYCWQEQGTILSSADGEAEAASPAPEPPPVNATKATPTGAADVLFEPNRGFADAREKGRVGTGAVVLDNFLATRADGSLATQADYDEEITFRFLVRATTALDSDCIASIRLRDVQGNYVFSAHDVFGNHRLKSAPGDRFVITLKTRLPLHHQHYGVLAGVFGFQGGNSAANGHYDFGLADLWDVVEDACFIKVNPCARMPLPGPVHVAAPVTITPLSP